MRILLVFNQDTSCMKWTYFIRQKLKVAFLLFCIMACSVMIRVLEDKNVKHMSNALLSMYDDRLVPASDIFDIAEHLHAKRFLFLVFVADQHPTMVGLERLAEQIEQRRTAIDSLLLKYGKTYLVADEKAYLTDFKRRLGAYRKIEGQLLTASAENLHARIRFYTQTGESALDGAIKKLSALEKLQTHVGKELMADAQFVISGTRFFSTLQLILSIVIGIMVVVLVLESKSMIKNKQPYNLN